LPVKYLNTKLNALEMVKKNVKLHPQSRSSKTAQKEDESVDTWLLISKWNALLNVPALANTVLSRDSWSCVGHSFVIPVLTWELELKT
jgi:accessory colonization factor AcfC